MSKNIARTVKALHNRADVAADRIRGLLLRVTRGPTITGGSGLMVGRAVDLQVYGLLRLGRDVTLSAGCLLSVGPGAELEIGDRCFIGRNTVVVATESIRVGDHVDIAEHCTIRDSDHVQTAQGRARGEAIREPVVIGSGCWLGAGVRVLRGSRLGPGVVAAANAVVRGTFDGGSLIGGVPARVLRRQESAEQPSRDG